MKRLHCLPLLLFALGLSRPVAAQEAPVLEGTVTTREDGLAFPGATVTVPAYSLTATSDPQGRYRIELPAEAAGRTIEVRAQASGFVPRSAPLRVAAGLNKHDLALSVSFSEEITVGSRAAGVAAEAAVPVDVLTSRQIEATGLTETMAVIQRLAPSFNFPRTTIADGSGSVRPATLRGLGPDQVLVLVNGKRRHAGALVHVNGTVGRGSTGVDMNAIPVSAIEKIEILRDGAAAQYGSDAIAGVINIVLKSGARAPSVSLQAGMTATDQGVGESVNDGETVDGGGHWGTALGKGWISLSAEYRDRSRTNRAGPDTRDQVRAGDANNNAVGQPNHWVGDPETKDLLTFANFQAPVNRAETVFLYAYGGWSQRDAVTPGFYRRALDARNWPQIYPLGFLPLIETAIADGSLTAGVQGSRGDWFLDLSAQHGRNAMDFDVTSSHNASLGPAIPPNQTEFFAGTYKSSQTALAFDASRKLDLGLAGPTNLAVGVEWRRETYGIEAGEPNSYRDGGVRDQFGGVAAAGAQVFPGLKPENEADASRSNVGLYADLEGDVRERVKVGVAGRFEHYSDFGSTVDGKLSVRIEAHDRAVVRGAIATGFRAPSLAQSHFSATSTNFINLGAGLVPVEVGTFPVASPLARALGSTDLEPEKSIHASAGLVLTPVDGLDVTVDYYYIRIDDRIVFSGNFTGAAVQSILRPFGVGGARFFTNAINTRTTGVDLVATWRRELANGDDVTVSGAFNYTDNNIAGQVQTPPQLAGLASVLFDRVERGRIECGQPKDSVRLSGDWQHRKLGTALRLNRFGEYCSLQPAAANDQTFSAKWLADLDLSWKFEKFTVAAGVQNFFDTYPEQQLVQNSIGGIIRYTTVVPFGINGRTLYARLHYRF